MYDALHDVRYTFPEKYPKSKKQIVLMCFI